MRSVTGSSVAAILAFVLGLDAGAARAVPASVNTPRVAKAPSVTKPGPVVSKRSTVGIPGAPRPQGVAGPPKFAAPPRGVRTQPGTSRLPVSRASGVTPTRHAGALGSAHPGVLGGPARYDGRQGGVLNGTGLKRRPTAP
jgi:hypothetical protein